MKDVLTAILLVSCLFGVVYLINILQSYEFGFSLFEFLGFEETTALVIKSLITFIIGVIGFTMILKPSKKQMN